MAKSFSLLLSDFGRFPPPDLPFHLDVLSKVLLLEAQQRSYCPKNQCLLFDGYLKVSLTENL
jgi:hypothetical protein